ncbi:uncharacterized protein I303_100054 [Kwoniella dejecticola CBS 10117]|uniref:Uncharacterized protein n=1 Tax=Kwoniella dejecticola CBS 10117 TaxID=1296121 RepID=A0A1A6ADX9_9TREE|nr:uncharacterized protein I303_00054 [Kwoniella dejecticola CBS 10117]OBR88243.1 hypothetical protein I303_00054 [Kwoniella dejecticola CBS 10117]
MYATLLKSSVLLVSLILVSLSLKVDARQTRQKRDVPTVLDIDVPEYMDKWDYTTEFNHLCTGIFPDDGEPESPILTETYAEYAKGNKLSIQNRAIDAPVKGTVFWVSCMYRYPDGEMHQLGQYIAEKVGGRMVRYVNADAHLDGKKKDKARR